MSFEAIARDMVQNLIHIVESLRYPQDGYEKLSANRKY